MKKLSLITLLVGATCVSHGQTIAQWTFETSVPAGVPGAGAWLTNIAAEVGSGTAAALHAGAATYSNPSGNGSAESFSVNTWSVGDFYQFVVSTIGYAGIAVSFDQASSQTGPGRFNFAYSTDGLNFTTHATDFVVLQSGGTLPPGTWNSTTYDPQYLLSFDLSGITALNNAATVYFRLVDSSTTSASGGTVNVTAGASRVDNFTVAVVPEPSTVALGLLGGLAAALAIRRRC